MVNSKRFSDNLPLKKPNILIPSLPTDIGISDEETCGCRKNRYEKLLFYFGFGVTSKSNTSNTYNMSYSFVKVRTTAGKSTRNCQITQPSTLMLQ